ncbi:MAG: hypothetical protein V3W19_11135 [Desulfatiglandales bacterium]
MSEREEFALPQQTQLMMGKTVERMLDGIAGKWLVHYAGEKQKDFLLQ